MRYAALSDPGRVRGNNEDSCHADGRAFIVADGMGGHLAGEVASSTAITEFLRFEEENRASHPLERIRGGIAAANLALNRMSGGDPELEGMGTTFTCVLVEGKLYLGHVGDSRAYVFREGELFRLTRDHSLVERMVSEGRITPIEARVHPQRNIILRALGMAEELEVDTDAVEFEPGDRVLLCSDGLSGSVGDGEIEALLGRCVEPEGCCRALVDAANERGGQDNITVVVMEFGEEDRAARARSARGRRPRWKALFSRGSG